MKAGLLGDVSPPEERDLLRVTNTPLQDQHLYPLFRALTPSHRARLRKGFGKGIARLFHDEEGERVIEAHLAREVDIRERLAIASVINERL